MWNWRRAIRFLTCMTLCGWSVGVEKRRVRLWMEGLLREVVVDTKAVWEVGLEVVETVR